MITDEIIFIDKQAGWTSFDIVAKIRGMIRARYQEKGVKPTKRQLKVGHTGTLDPFATGLVIVLLGDACSRSDEFLKLDKVYEATIRLGQTSTTGDPEGEISTFDDRGSMLDNAEMQMSATVQASSIKNQTSSLPPLIPSRTQVLDALSAFTGAITQVPPMHSAIKINGQRAYKLARAGKTVEMPPRQVTIYALDLIDYTYPELKIRTNVSSGTYIRTLAQDIGEVLGTGAYCKELRRTKIADFDLKNAKSIAEINIDNL